MDVRDVIRRVLLANELGGHAGLAYRFSDPDGKAGRSGYSFGLCQFDIRHNPRAIACLREADFTEQEIGRLEAQAGPIADLNAKLAAAAAVVDRWDASELDAIIRHVRQVVTGAGLRLADEEAFVHLADYHNQFHLSFGGKCVRHFQRLGEPVDAANMLTFKLATEWGRKRPDDVRRRWNTIVRICRAADHARIDEIRAGHQEQKR